MRWQLISLVLVGIFAVFLLTTDTAFEKTTGGWARSFFGSAGTETVAVSKDASQSFYENSNSFRESIATRLITYREELRNKLPPKTKNASPLSYITFFGIATLAFFFIYKILFYGAIILFVYLVYTLIRNRHTY